MLVVAGSLAAEILPAKPCFYINFQYIYAKNGPLGRLRLPPTSTTSRAPARPQVPWGSEAAVEHERGASVTKEQYNEVSPKTTVSTRSDPDAQARHRTATPKSTRATSTSRPSSTLTFARRVTTRCGA